MPGPGPMLAALLFAVGTQPAPGPSDPIGLFMGACISNEVRLPRGQFANSFYEELPDDAKDALGFALEPGDTPPYQLHPGNFPNRVLAGLSDRNVFLMLPAPGEAGAAAAVCAVIWKGHDYPRALAALRKIAGRKNPQDLPPSTSIPGLNFAVFHVNGAHAGAAELAGWTVLRIDPATSPTLELPSQ